MEVVRFCLDCSQSSLDVHHLGADVSEDLWAGTMLSHGLVHLILRELSTFQKRYLTCLKS